MSNWQSFKKKHVLLMNAAFTVAIPAAVWLIMELLNLAFCGVHTLNSTVDYTTLMRNLVTSFCFALGLNCNLPVGRMDTSTGSQMYLACIIGGNIALSLNLGGVGVLVFSMLFGMLAGGFVGFLFINMRILPMVLGLGISLVYECISFSMYNQQGLNLFGKPGVSILSNWGFIIVVTLLVMLVYDLPVPVQRLWLQSPRHPGQPEAGPRCRHQHLQERFPVLRCSRCAGCHRRCV